MKKAVYINDLQHVESMVMIEGAKAGRIGIVKMMLNYGIKINFRDPDGRPCSPPKLFARPHMISTDASRVWSGCGRALRYSR